MQNTSIYNGGLTREQFLFYESRVIASLICQGYQREKILEKVIEDNLFQFPTERMIKLIAKLKNQALEIRQYEEKLHLADMMIPIDLDDGVKVNYAKFQDVLEKIR